MLFSYAGICRYFRHSASSLPVLQQPIYAIQIGTWVPKIGESNRRPLAILKPSASLSEALNLLIQGVYSVSLTCSYLMINSSQQAKLPPKS